MSKMLFKMTGYKPIVKGFMGRFCTFSHTIFENKVFMNAIKLEMGEMLMADGTWIL